MKKGTKVRHGSLWNLYKPQNHKNKKTMKRAKVQELPAMVGPGVEILKDKALDSLGDEFIEVRDKKAKLAEELGLIEDKIKGRMKDKGITTYRFGDQEMSIKPGNDHVKVKTIKVGSNGNGADEQEDEE
jgi:hypothetical protein